MARFEYKFNGGSLREFEFSGDLAIVLPDEHADLKDQRAMMRALAMVFPDADIKLLSHTDLEDGSSVTRTVKMDIKHPRRNDAEED